jgi:hypothetical protein
VVTDLIPWTTAPVFHTGTRNEIAIETDGQNIWCFINGKMAGSVAAPVPVKGYVGFYVTEFGMRARFSSLQVVQLSK